MPTSQVFLKSSTIVNNNGDYCLCSSAKTTQTPWSVQKEGVELLQVPELRFPCRPWCSPWRRSCVPAAHGGPPGCKDPPAISGEDLHQRRWMPEREWWHHGRPMLGVPGRNLQTRGVRSPCWTRFPGRTYDPVRDPHWNRLCLKHCTPEKSDPCCSILRSTVIFCHLQG